MSTHRTSISLNTRCQTMKDDSVEDIGASSTPEVASLDDLTVKLSEQMSAVCEKYPEIVDVLQTMQDISSQEKDIHQKHVTDLEKMNNLNETRIDRLSRELAVTKDKLIKSEIIT